MKFSKTQLTMSAALAFGLVFGAALNIYPSPAHAASEVELAGAYSSTEIREMIRRLAKEDGRVPASLVLAVAKVESNFDPDALSFKGARGVMQIMPDTAKKELHVHPDDLWDPETNISLGIEYLARLYEQYGNRWDAALSHYNGGSLSGDPVTAHPHAYNAGYVRTVLALQESFDDAAGEPVYLAAHDQKEATPPVAQEDIVSKNAETEEVMLLASCEPAEPVIQLAETKQAEPAYSYGAVSGADLSPAGQLLAKIDESRLRFRYALQATQR